jgi:mRNA interferase MazF
MLTSGVVLVDQIRTIHRFSRLFDIIESAPPEVIAEVRGRLAALLGFGADPPIVEG